MTIRDLSRPLRFVPILAVVTLVACSDRVGDAEAPSVRALLARGAAHAEIDQWAEARELFEQAAELDSEESAAAYDLAIASFRAGDRPVAREHLARAPRVTSS